MFCSKCGNSVPEGTFFCTNCGTAVADFAAAKPVVDEPAYQAPVYEETPAYQAPVYEEAPAYQAPVAEEAPAAEKAPKIKLAAAESAGWKSLLLAAIITVGAITMSFFYTLIVTRCRFAAVGHSVYGYIIALLLPAVIFLVMNKNLKIGSTKVLLFAALGIIAVQLSAAFLGFILFFTGTADIISWINGAMVLNNMASMFAGNSIGASFFAMTISCAYIAKNVFCLLAIKQMIGE